MTEKHRKCADNEGLGCSGNDKFMIGYVSEVNGPDSAEIPDFVPTRHELLQLVKYWATVVLDHQFFYFCYGQTGSSEWRRKAFANRRIDRIATLLGEDQVQKAIQESEEEFRKTTDPRAWAIFKSGTREERKAFQDEIQQRLGDSSEQGDRPSTAE